MNIVVDITQTLLVALIILFSGYFFNSKISFLKNNNIPEPVVGGIVFSLILTFFHSYLDLNFQFDMGLKNPLMTMFFTTVGLGASFSLLVKGGCIPASDKLFAPE
jgi:ESS family glutamate:Na+ symporter